MYNIYKARSKLTLTLIISLLYSLVFSRLRYCNSLFINIPQKLMKKFDSIQRRADRILFKFKRTDITIFIHSIMTIIGWLKFRLLRITHNSIYMGFPEYIRKRVRIRACSSCNYSSADKILCAICIIHVCRFYFYFCCSKVLEQSSR